ncbi:MAG: type II secretion system protein GspM [bacterium]
MKIWFSKLAQREQRLILIGSYALFFMLAWAWGVQPAYEQIRSEQARVDQSIKDLEWMQQTASKVGSLRSTSKRSFKNRAGLSNIALVDQSARLQGMENGIRKVEPAGEKQVRIWFEKIQFNALVHWIERLQKDYGLVVTQIQVDQDQLPGMVKAQVTLKQALSNG